MIKNKRVDEPTHHPPAPKFRRASGKRKFYAWTASAFRWLHIYVSMLSFASLLFFAATGITLNHPTWFGGSQQSIKDHAGTLPAELVASEQLDRLDVAEWLRSEHRLKGRVAEFEISDLDCLIVFKGPGYSADVFVDRESRNYTLTETKHSLMAILNDLHKGRDSGLGWAWVIDISAVVMILMSLFGFGLLFYLKKRRRSGIILAVAGTLLMFVAWFAFVR